MALLSSVLEIKNDLQLKEFKFKFESYPESYFSFLSRDPLLFCAGLNYIRPDPGEEVELIPQDLAQPTFSQLHVSCFPISAKFKTFTSLAGDRDPFELTTYDQNTAIFLSNAILEKNLEIILLREGWVSRPRVTEEEYFLRNRNGEPLYRIFEFEKDSSVLTVSTTTEPQTKLEFLAFFATTEVGFNRSGALKTFEVSRD